mgnify:CR=1 FL=1
MWLALETSADRASVAVGRPGRFRVDRRIVGELLQLLRRELEHVDVRVAVPLRKRQGQARPIR